MFGHVQRREGHGCSEGEPRKETAGRRRLKILLLRGDVGVPDGEADEAKETNGDQSRSEAVLGLHI